jgi:hypothetical protein
MPAGPIEFIGGTGRFEGATGTGAWFGEAQGYGTILFEIMGTISFFERAGGWGAGSRVRVPRPRSRLGHVQTGAHAGT